MSHANVSHASVDRRHLRVGAAATAAVLPSAAALAGVNSSQTQETEMTTFTKTAPPESLLAM
jgi:hypothetical protein